MKKQINILWFIPVIILSGIFGFFTSSFSFFEFKSEIDLISLITLILTSAIGIYIASSLQKNLEAKKFEKELLHTSIKFLSEKSKLIDRHLTDNSLKFSETVKLFKSISSEISELEEVNELCKMIDCNKITNLRSLFIELKPLITGGSKVDNKLILSSEHKGLSKIKLKCFRNSLINLMIETNRK